MDKKEIFEKAPVHKAVVSMALPTILSMIVMILYNMADTFFVGQTHNSLYVSAVSLASPLFLIFTAFSSMFGAGGSSVISRALGMGEKEKAKRVSAIVCYASILFGLVMSAVVLLGMDVILRILGTDESTYGYTKGYLTWIGIGAVFSIFSGAFSNIIRSEGASKDSMIGNIAGSVTNIILDPILILALNMGVKGAAIATVIGNMVACIIYASYFFRKETALSIRFRDFHPTPRLIWEIVSIGFPSTMVSILATTANVVLNRILVSYSNAAVAGMGVAMKINTVAVYVQLGLGTGIQPLIGYNYGAGNKKRLSDIFKFSSVTAVVLGSVLTAVMVVLRTPLVHAFIDDPEVIAYGTKILVALQMAGPILGLMFIGTNMIQAIGKVAASFVLNLLRQGIFLIPLLFILNYFFGLDGVIYSNTIADYGAVIVSYAVCIAYIRKMK